MSHPISSSNVNNLQANDASLDDLKSTLKNIAKRNGLADEAATTIVEKMAADGIISVDEVHDSFKRFDIDGDGKRNQKDLQFWKVNLKQDIQSFTSRLKLFSKIESFFNQPNNQDCSKSTEPPASDADKSSDSTKKPEDEVTYE